MKTIELLDRPIAYHRVFVTLVGSVKGAIMLSQAMYWQNRAKQTDGWWYKTAQEWEDETGLTRREQEKARKDCEKFLETDLRDSPARLYWRVNDDVLMAALFVQKGETSFDKRVKLVSTKRENSNRKAETTTETTAKDSAAVAAPPPGELRKHQAIQAYRDRAHLYPPETWLRNVIDVVGEAPEQIERFKALVDSWIGRGYNPRNIAGMLDAFQAGGLPKQVGGRNGTRPIDNEGESDAANEWLRKKLAAGKAAT